MARIPLSPREARAWLPPAAVRALDIDGTLAALARAWSAKWFAREAVRPLEALSTGSAPSLAGGDGLVLDGDIAVCLTASGKAALLGLMLDLDLPNDPPTAADERLLDELLQPCLDDLCRRLAEALRLDTAARWSQLAAETGLPIAEPRTCTLGIESHMPLLRITVADDALIALAKARLAPPAKLQRLVPLGEALGAQDIAVSAHLGRCSLTLAEISGLGIGDVLVFHRAIDAPLDVFVNGTGAAVAQCRIVHADGRLDLTLLDPIGG